LDKYHIHPVTNIEDGAFFTQLDNDLCLRIMDDLHNNVGFQLRIFNALGAKSKYLTTTLFPGSNIAAWFSDIVRDDRSKLFVTEDYTSAYRIWRDTGFDTVALLRTTMGSNTMEIIRMRRYQEINIWLDPDEAGKKGARKLVDRLKYVMTSAINRFTWFSEAKSYPPKDLKEMCNDTALSSKFDYL
jgi:DNA primase